MAFSAISGSNGYIPMREANGPIIGFLRNINRFRINQYVSILPAEKDKGFYLALDPDEAMRIVDEADFAWEDGADAPTGEGNKLEFEYRPFTAFRRAFPFRIGYQAARFADWPVVAVHARAAAIKAMTLRTVRACALLFNPANWGANTAAATDVSLAGAGGGAWSASTTAQLFIKRCILGALVRIDLGSGGIISDPDGVCMVISPELARAMSQSPEVHAYLANSPHALAMIEGKISANWKYGLPDFMYGVRLVIENAVRVVTRKGGGQTRQRIVPANAAVIVTEPTRAVDGADGGGGVDMDFTTIAFRFLRQNEVYLKDDPDNERHVGRVVEHYAVTLQAPETGFLITGLS
jgi:hypothetical protein